MITTCAGIEATNSQQAQAAGVDAEGSGRSRFAAPLGLRQPVEMLSTVNQTGNVPALTRDDDLALIDAVVVASSDCPRAPDGGVCGVSDHEDDVAVAAAVGLPRP